MGTGEVEPVGVGCWTCAADIAGAVTAYGRRHGGGAAGDRRATIRTTRRTATPGLTSVGL